MTIIQNGELVLFKSDNIRIVGGDHSSVTVEADGLTPKGDPMRVHINLSKNEITQLTKTAVLNLAS